MYSIYIYIYILYNIYMLYIYIYYIYMERYLSLNLPYEITKISLKQWTSYNKKINGCFGRFWLFGLVLLMFFWLP